MVAAALLLAPALPLAPVAAGTAAAAATLLVGGTAHLAEGAFGFRRGPAALPPLTGKELEPTLQEMLADFAAGAKVNSTNPPPPGVPPNWSTLVGVAAAGFGKLADQFWQSAANLWGMLNYDRKKRSKWPRKYDVLAWPTGRWDPNGINRWDFLATSLIRHQSETGDCINPGMFDDTSASVTTTTGRLAWIAKPETSYQYACPGVLHNADCFVWAPDVTDPKGMGAPEGGLADILHTGGTRSFGIVATVSSASPNAVPFKSLEELKEEEQKSGGRIVIAFPLRIPARLPRLIKPAPALLPATTPQTQTEPDIAPPGARVGIAQPIGTPPPRFPGWVKPSRLAPFAVPGWSPGQPAPAEPGLVPQLEPAPGDTRQPVGPGFPLPTAQARRPIPRPARLIVPLGGASRGTGPDGVPLPQTSPSPTTTKPGVHVVGGTLVQPKAPPATLAGIAREVGRIENKTARILKDGPQAMPPNLGDLAGLVQQVIQALAGLNDQGSYSLGGPCERDEQGNAIPFAETVETWEWGGSPFVLQNIAQRVDVLAEMMQKAQLLRQPTCKNPPPVGELVSVQFREVDP